MAVQLAPRISQNYRAEALAQDEAPIRSARAPAATADVTPSPATPAAATSADPARADTALRAHIASGNYRAYSLHSAFDAAQGTSDVAQGTSTSAQSTSAPVASPTRAPASANAPDSVNAQDPVGARNNLELARDLWRQNPADPANIERLEQALADATLAGKPKETDAHADNMGELARQMRQDAAEAQRQADAGEIPQEEADRQRDAAEEATVQAYEAKMGIEHDAPADKGQRSDDRSSDRGADGGSGSTDTASPENADNGGGGGGGGGGAVGGGGGDDNFPVELE
ncbi:MAG: hypothetical protein U1E65_21475 [Myxococcota bacterium]